MTDSPSMPEYEPMRDLDIWIYAPAGMYEALEPAVDSAVTDIIAYAERRLQEAGESIAWAVTS